MKRMFIVPTVLLSSLLVTAPSLAQTDAGWIWIVSKIPFKFVKGSDWTSSPHIIGANNIDLKIAFGTPTHNDQNSFVCTPSYAGFYGKTTNIAPSQISAIQGNSESYIQSNVFIQTPTNIPNDPSLNSFDAEGVIAVGFPAQSTRCWNANIQLDITLTRGSSTLKTSCSANYNDFTDPTGGAFIYYDGVNETLRCDMHQRTMG